MKITFLEEPPFIIISDPGANVIKLFTVLISVCSNMLEYLYRQAFLARFKALKEPILG
jgi:hypothetical protein